MKTIAALLTTLFLTTCTMVPVQAVVYTGPVAPDGSCVIQSEVIKVVIDATVPGTKVAITNPKFVVFSNPEYSTYYKVNFDDAGCATVAEVIDQVQFDLLNTGT